MIELYTFATPNGRKVPIALEEMGLPYEVKVVHIGKGEQHRPEFLAVNPNGKIPAIVDREGPGGRPFTLFESGAILLYLAEKSGRFLSPDARVRHTTVQWLMFQMGGVGPMFGQASHFVKFAKEKVPYAIERYTTEARRILGVLDGELGKREYLAGEYSVADMATYPWVEALAGMLPEVMEGRAGLQAWRERVGARPAVQRGMKVPDLGH
jgi:GST-like protein